VVQLLAVELVAQLAQTHGKSVTPRVLAEDDSGAGGADRVGAHDLVGLLVLEDAVLVNAALMGKGVGADNRLVGLYRHSGAGGDQARYARQLSRIDVGIESILRTRAQRHDHFFQGAISRALADAIDGHLRLTRAGAQAGQRIRRGEAQIVVT